MQKNEQIPALRVKALVEMAKHANKRKQGKVLMKMKDGTQKTYMKEENLSKARLSLRLFDNTHGFLLGNVICLHHGPETFLPSHFLLRLFWSLVHFHGFFSPLGSCIMSLFYSKASG